jgi:adenine deaminase
MPSVIKANLVDILNRQIFGAVVTISNQKIERIEAIDEVFDTYILPGFVDAHIHIESSMLLPSEFARIAVKHGTVATVSDPHEIANVCGVQGVHYMIRNGKQVPFKFNFGAPSCVPATNFETAGAVIDSKAVAELLALPDIKYLSEMMNYPGVLFKDAEVLAKIAAAHAAGKPVDGHAPGVTGDAAIAYINAGISTDHECFTLEEAKHKLAHGMKVLIREGSAARNFAALHPLIPAFYEQLMFCCDDKHPDELLLHHINKHVTDAIALGYNVFDVLQMACVNPVQHYKLDVGLLRVGDEADFIVVDNLKDFNILATYINGEVVYEAGQVNMPQVEATPINAFGIGELSQEELVVPFKDEKTIPVIVAQDGELITKRVDVTPLHSNGEIISNVSEDILKIVVVNRYSKAPVAKAFIKNIGLKRGAIASTVGHDCHNIIAVGTNDEDLCTAINELVKCKGGVCAVNGQHIESLALPVAGLMSLEDAHTTAKKYETIDAMAKSLGSKLRAPFMTLSFMALLVIPSLKLSDKGLFDGEKFEFV